MKLIKSDFNYLGIDLNKYPSEQLGILNDFEDLTVEKLVSALLDKYKYFEEYKFEACDKINSSLYDIFKKLRSDIPDPEKIGNRDGYAYKIILNAMIELREKDINTISKKDLFAFWHNPEGAEIPDHFLYKYEWKGERLLSLLKERNIERLRKLLFKEKFKEKFKEYFKELEGMLNEID